jgi:hypothetical protein
MYGKRKIRQDEKAFFHHNLIFKKCANRGRASEEMVWKKSGTQEER